MSKGVFVWRLRMSGIRAECVQWFEGARRSDIRSPLAESVPEETHGILTRKGVACDESEERRYDRSLSRCFCCTAVWIVLSRLKRRVFQPILFVGCAGWGASAVFRRVA